MEQGDIYVSIWEYYTMQMLEFLSEPKEALQPFQNSFLLQDASSLRFSRTQRNLVLSDY